MDRIWIDLYNAAKAVQNPRELSERVYAGGVAAAIESTSGNIYSLFSYFREKKPTEKKKYKGDTFALD